MIQLILWIVLVVAMVIILKYKLWNSSTWKTFFVDKNKNYIPDVVEEDFKKLKSELTNSEKAETKIDDNVAIKEEIKSTVKRVKKTGDQIDETGEQSVTRSKKRK